MSFFFRHVDVDTLLNEDRVGMLSIVLISLSFLPRTF